MPAPPPPRTAGAQPCRAHPQSAPGRPPRAFLDLGAVLTAPRCARAWTKQILWEWQLTELSDTAELVVGELVANSVKASRGLDRPALQLILTFDLGELAMLVRDNHPGAPQTRHPDADAESGRGLLVVENLTARSGWYPLEDGTGKVVWAVLPRLG